MKGGDELRKHLGIWLIWITLVAVAAADVAVNGWHAIFSTEDALDASLGTSAANAARISHIAMGREYTTSVAAADVERLVIDNPAGSVVVHGMANNDNIELQAWLIVYTNDENESKEVLEQTQFTVVTDHGVLRPELDPDPGTLLSADSPWDVLWEISVPSHIHVDIVNRYGPVRVQGLSGALHVTNERDLVDISEVEGTVHVVLYDGQLEVQQVDGAIVVEASNSELHLSSVTGSIELEASDSDITGSMFHGHSHLNVTSGHIHLSEFSGDIALRLVDTSMFARTTQPFETLSADIIGQNAVFEFPDNEAVGEMDVRVESSHVAFLIPPPVDHTFNIHVRRGARLVSEWDFELAAEDGGKLYRAVFGEGSHLFTIEAVNGARVNLGLPQSNREIRMFIEQNILSP